MARLIIIAMFATSLLTGCATAIVTPELESEMGAQMSQEVANQIGLYRDPGLEAYVSAVGQRLVAALGPTPYTFRFAIVDQSDPNAFASPGGYIYISRGLLVQMNDEAELAGVLGHEISHVTQRHHTRQIGKNIGAGILTLPGRAVGVVSENLGNIINSPINAVNKVFLSSYSRGQETEADEYGMALAAKSGYEPTALIGALEGIERSVEYFSGEDRQASFFDSHPTTPARVADIRLRGETIPRTPAAPLANQNQLARHIDGLWWGQQNPQQGIFQGQTYLNADFNFRLQFPLEWKTVNSPAYVGASAPDGDAYIVLRGSEEAITVTELSTTLVSQMRDQTALEPSERRAIDIGGWPGEVIRYDHSSDNETVSLYFLFVDSGEITFSLMAMGLEHYRNDLRDIAQSLRQLTEPERNSIGGLRVRVAQTRTGETLTSFGQREGNKWSPELTGIINAIEDDSALPKNTLLKLVRPERYVP